MAIKSSPCNYKIKPLQLPYGGGDYTKERHGWLDQQSFEELAKPPKKATDRKT